MQRAPPCRGKRRSRRSWTRSRDRSLLAVIIIIVTGLTLAFGDSTGGFRRLIQIVFGLSIAFAASSFFLSFFSFGGGALL
jgi:type IV secretory pathway VirB2 component (pilin)